MNHFSKPDTLLNDISRESYKNNQNNQINLNKGIDDYNKPINKIDNNSAIIGKIIDNEGLRLFSINNKLLDTSGKPTGYKHF